MFRRGGIWVSSCKDRVAGGWEGCRSEMQGRAKAGCGKGIDAGSWQAAFRSLSLLGYLMEDYLTGAKRLLVAGWIFIELRFTLVLVCILYFSFIHHL